MGVSIKRINDLKRDFNSALIVSIQRSALSDSHRHPKDSVFKRMAKFEQSRTAPFLVDRPQPGKGIG